MKGVTVPPTVSVPEKTLEHWCSQYVTYRYRAQAGLWWPTTGADIDVRFLPNAPGKAFQLELKTTSFGVGYHDVKVDLGQLLRYWNGRRASQPFYAFPWPKWQGELEARALAAGVEPTALGFSRSGPDWWFAEWMVVLTIDDVMRVLAPEIHAHRAAHAAAGTSEEKRGNDQTLVRFRPNAAGGAWDPTWGSHGGPVPAAIPWRDFWRRIEDCGDPLWPQMVQLPQSLVGASPLPHADVRSLLRELGASSWSDLGPLVWLGPSEDRGFVQFDPSTRDSARSPRELPIASEQPVSLGPNSDEPASDASADPAPAEDNELLDSDLPQSRPASDESLSDDAIDNRQLTFLSARTLV